METEEKVSKNLQWHPAFFAGIQIELEEEKVSTQILEHGFVLPLAGSKAFSGFVVNLSTGDIRLRDTAVLTNVGNRMLFSESLFAMAQTRTMKEAVQAVTEMIE